MRLYTRLITGKIDTALAAFPTKAVPVIDIAMVNPEDFMNDKEQPEYATVVTNGTPEFTYEGIPIWPMHHVAPMEVSLGRLYYSGKFRDQYSKGAEIKMALTFLYREGRMPDFILLNGVDFYDIKDIQKDPTEFRGRFSGFQVFPVHRVEAGTFQLGRFVQP